jgi:regulator of cell morphogenesis and NO signaling
MDTIDPDRTLAELVLARPGLARRFDELGLDYCCGGATSLADAVNAAGLDRAATIADLESVPSEPSPAPSGADMGELVDWIEATHHAYLRDVLPRLVALADKVASVHGGNHPELAEVAALVHAIRADLEPHLVKEERVLFPMVRELAVATSAPDFHCGALSNPISVMLREHDAVGAMLARLRDLSDGYTVPADGCGSYHALVTGLAELEGDTHRHVHVENNVLFPAVLAAEHELAARAGALDEGGEAPCWAHLIEPS